MKAMRDIWSIQWVRFSIMGGISTGLMYVIYLFLNLILEYQMAYLIAYVMTVVVSYFLNTCFVFRTNMSWKSFIEFPLVYVAQYGISAIALEVLVRLGYSVVYAPLFIILFLLPLTFMLSQLIIVKRR